MKRLLPILLSLGLAGCVGPLTERNENKTPPSRSQTPSVGPNTQPLRPIPDKTPDGEIEFRPGDKVSDLKDPTPEGVPKAALEKGDQKAEQKSELQHPQPVGGAQTLSCPAKFVRRVGSRRGLSRLGFVVHYTVSRNTPGRGDINAVRNFFRTIEADSTYGIDFEGNCEQWKSSALAPYTQKSFNATSESVEIIATGSETRRQWMESPLIKKGLLAELIRDRLRSMGSPLQFVDPVGCTPKRGWTDHNHLECGNDHTDVGKNFPFAYVQRQVLGKVPISQSAKWCHSISRRKTSIKKVYRHRPP